MKVERTISPKIIFCQPDGVDMTTPTAESLEQLAEANLRSDKGTEIAKQYLAFKNDPSQPEPTLKELTALCRELAGLRLPDNADRPQRKAYYKYLLGLTESAGEKELALETLHGKTTVIEEVFNALALDPAKFDRLKFLTLNEEQRGHLFALIFRSANLNMQGFALRGHRVNTNIISGDSAIGNDGCTHFKKVEDPEQEANRPKGFDRRIYYDLANTIRSIHNDLVMGKSPDDYRYACVYRLSQNRSSYADRDPPPQEWKDLWYPKIADCNTEAKRVVLTEEMHSLLIGLAHEQDRLKFKIHLNPTPENLPLVFHSLCSLIHDNPTLAKSIRHFKVITASGEETELVDKRFPPIVIYLEIPEAAQEAVDQAITTLQILKEGLSGLENLAKPLEFGPRFNYPVSKLIHLAQSDADIKYELRAFPHPKTQAICLDYLYSNLTNYAFSTRDAEQLCTRIEAMRTATFTTEHNQSASRIKLYNQVFILGSSTLKLTEEEHGPKSRSMYFSKIDYSDPDKISFLIKVVELNNMSLKCVLDTVADDDGTFKLVVNGKAKRVHQARVVAKDLARNIIELVKNELLHHEK